MSAIGRDGDWLVLRVYNASPTSSELSIPGARGAQTDLRGERIRPFADTTSLGPWQIMTLALDEW